MRNMKKANDTDLFFLKLLANIDRFYEYCIKKLCIFETVWVEYLHEHVNNQNDAHFLVLIFS